MLDVDEVGLLLADPDDGDLEVVASTSEESRIVETMQLDAGAGPCWTSFRTGEPVSLPDIDVDAGALARVRGERARAGLPLGVSRCRCACGRPPSAR